MLYIVGTPIGNLADLSRRQVKIITSADILLSEDTRTTGNLLSHIKTVWGMVPATNQYQISYYKEKEFEKLPEIIKLLREDRSVALVSESGMPTVSDPGALLIQQVVKERISFTVIPGPAAFVTAAVMSGFRYADLHFLGFLPKREPELKKSVQFIKSISSMKPEQVFVFYESAKRIDRSLKAVEDIMPHAKVAICREMTKTFEEVIRGAASELRKRSYRGELTVVVSAS